MYQTILAHILPSEKLVANNGKIIPLQDEDYLATLYQSFKNWLGRTKYIPVLKEHQTDGKTWGKVEDIFMKPSGIYAKLKVNQEIFEDIKSGKIQFVSPSIAWGFLDDKGKRWSAILQEVSFVSIPRFLIGQEPISKLNKDFVDASLFSQTTNNIKELKVLGSDGWNIILFDDRANNLNLRVSEEPNNTNLSQIEEQNNTYIKEISKEEINMSLDDLKLMFEELLNSKLEVLKKEIMDSLPKPEVKEEVEEVMAEESELPEVEVEVSPSENPSEEAIEEVDPKDLEIEELKAKLAEYEKMACDKVKMSAIEKDLKGKEIKPELVEKLNKLYDHDIELYKSMLDLIPSKQDFSQKIVTGNIYSSKRVKSQEEILELALKIQKEKGVLFPEAIKLAKGE